MTGLLTASEWSLVELDESLSGRAAVRNACLRNGVDLVRGVTEARCDSPAAWQVTVQQRRERRGRDMSRERAVVLGCVALPCALWMLIGVAVVLLLAAIE